MLWLYWRAIMPRLLSRFYETKTPTLCRSRDLTDFIFVFFGYNQEDLKTAKTKQNSTPILTRWLRHNPLGGKGLVSVDSRLIFKLRS
jgi:hypothetical protein